MAIPSLKERTKETNVGLVKPFARREVTYNPQIAMHIGGKFKNWDFRNTLEKNIPKFMPIELADKKPMFRYTQPTELTRTQRSGYEFGEGLRTLENDIAEANEYKEYVNAKTLADVKKGEPTGAMETKALIAHKPMPEQPSPHGTNADPSGMSIGNDRGGKGSAKGNIKLAASIPLPPPEDTEMEDLTNRMDVDQVGSSKVKKGKSKTPAPTLAPTRFGSASMLPPPPARTKAEKGKGKAVVGASSSRASNSAPTPTPMEGIQGFSNRGNYRPADNTYRETVNVPLNKEPPRMLDAPSHARETRHRSGVTAPAGEFAQQMDELADSMSNKMSISLNRNPTQGTYDPEFMARTQRKRKGITHQAGRKIADQFGGHSYLGKHGRGKQTAVERLEEPLRKREPEQETDAEYYARMKKKRTFAQKPAVKKPKPEKPTVRRLVRPKEKVPVREIGRKAGDQFGGYTNLGKHHKGKYVKSTEEKAAEQQKKKKKHN